MLAGLTSLIATVGCSAGGRSQAKNRRRADGKRPKGPKTMGNLLVEGYIADLKNGTTESKITAARELANLGDAASGVGAASPSSFLPVHSRGVRRGERARTRRAPKRRT
ncbi:MAG: hypothetical protein EBS56_10045, partial [Planctomycetia bacterium]|nr:hypothetical protein [Planctomycetia bacterium]